MPEILYLFLRLFGGVALFLFGMRVMNDTLRYAAGARLGDLLHRLTKNPLGGYLLGVGVTAAIQSSNAVTVTVVGFVDAGLMTLGEALYVIMGSNLGTTATAWLLAVSEIGKNATTVLSFFSPAVLSPLSALVGIFFYLSPGGKRRSAGGILLGFAVLLFGMNEMSEAAHGFSGYPFFRDMFLRYMHPLLGVAVGAVITAVIQSSSAAVGILQALSVGTVMTVRSAFPLIMGLNIGACITTLIAAVGTSDNAKKAALLHLYFNLFGTAVWLPVFLIVAMFRPAFADAAVNPVYIAALHSLFQIATAVLLLPLKRLLLFCAGKTVLLFQKKEKEM